LKKLSIIITNIIAVEVLRMYLGAHEYPRVCTQTESRQQIADSRQETGDRRRQIADRREQRTESRQQTADSRQHIAHSR
jgi:hypothetical protein